MKKGFLYLVAVMDRYSRKVLSWQISNSMDTEFCVATVEEALAKYGKPDIFNTDQGSQFSGVTYQQADSELMRENSTQRKHS